MKRPCIQCGAVTTNGTRCPAHELKQWRGVVGSASARGYGAAWRTLRKRILERDPTCRWPEGCDRPSTDVDHIMNRARGGTDDPSNLQGLCRDHHRAKTRREGLIAQGHR